MVEESDDRVAQIRELMMELDDYSPRSTAGPDKAELLILLFELEGVLGRVHEAYYRAAIEWNGVGEKAEAVKYARLCIDRGLAFRGPKRPFIDAMKEIVKNPEEHWSWKFRLREAL